MPNRVRAATDTVYYCMLREYVRSAVGENTFGSSEIAVVVIDGLFFWLLGGICGLDGIGVVS